MGFLQDLAPLFQKRALTFLEKANEAGNVASAVSAFQPHQDKSILSLASC